MYLGALLCSLFSINLTIPTFLTGVKDNLTISVAGCSDVSLYVVFGDGHAVDSRVDSSEFDFLPRTTPAKDSFHFVNVSVAHSYASQGNYTILVNVSSSRSHIVTEDTAVVFDAIAGVRLQLFSRPLVALFEEVTVQATVECGSHLNFDWDFGDSTHGEYTVINSDTNSSIAHHSYGIADLYSVSVTVTSQKHDQQVRAYLNTSIQAVEPIEQLFLRPIPDRYAAPLLETRTREWGEPSTSYATRVVLFEAKLWRGSDVDFLFEFGDGHQELVPSVLNVWSVPHGVAKHVYTEEGEYIVAVTATNPLGSVRQLLGKPFFVQFPPQSLSLDRRYYIIPKGNTLHLRATLVRGTNVSFEWFLEENQLRGKTGPTVSIHFMISGAYSISVVAYNEVTDHANDISSRPSVSSKVYVQEPLEGIELCVKSPEGHVLCDGFEIDLPLEEEVELQALVKPTSEVSLRFIWQIGILDLKRSNFPSLKHKFRDPGWYLINVTAQNHISSISSGFIRLNMVQKIGNLTAIRHEGASLVNQLCTFHALYWFGTDLTFEWDFGDGSLPLYTHVASVQHTYTQVGEYWVTVRAWNKFSEANITTNIFFLHQLCLKPEITFLDQSRDMIVTSMEDILLEADFTIMCNASNTTIYTWTFLDTSGVNTPKILPLDRFHQRQLLLPRNLLLPGFYIIELKVQMIGTIVYGTAHTSLTIMAPKPVIFVRGGFFRWVGKHDIVIMSVDVSSEHQVHQPLRYHWSCSSLISSHVSCFEEGSPVVLSGASIPNFKLPVSSLNRRLQAVMFNVTVLSEVTASSSQVLEVIDSLHTLLISVHCIECINHKINQHQLLTFIATCDNCIDADIEYEWKIYIVQDGNHDFRFDHYECVQADGSTFYILAPNTTSQSTYTTPDPYDIGEFASTTSQSFTKETVSSFGSDDFPPFPSLPGFPDEPELSVSEDSIVASERKIRSPKGSAYEEDPPTKNLFFPQFLVEGETHYEDNFSLPDTLLIQELLPPPHESMFSQSNPDQHLTEEGLPGEGGSAAARDQSLQNLGVFLPSSNHDDQILEEAGKGRGMTSNTHSGFYPPVNHDLVGDPVQDDRISYSPSIPHLARRPRLLLSLHPDETTTGFNSKHLILKPGILHIGRTYIVQASAVRKGSNKMEGSAMDYVKINSGPTNGRCTLMPIQGYSLNFTFRLHCLEWQSNYPPLYYELSYSLDPDSQNHLIYFGLNRNVKFILPPGRPENGFNVYLNVIVRDSQGASTKVCSLVREVSPLNISIPLKNYLLNETFHPRSVFNKLVGESQNQAVLHRIHVFLTVLNDLYVQHDYFSNRQEFVHENFQLQKKMRWRFLELLNNMAFFSKAEAVQALSVLKTLILPFNKMTISDLKYCWMIFERIYNRKSAYGGTYPSEILVKEFLAILAQFNFVLKTHSPELNFEFMELFETSKGVFKSEVKEILRSMVIHEDFFGMELPYLTFNAGHITMKEGDTKEYTIAIEDIVVILPCCLDSLIKNSFSDSDIMDFHGINSYEMKQSEETCTAVIVQNDWAAIFPNLGLPNVDGKLSVLDWPTISISFYSCASYEEFPLQMLPNNETFTVQFQRHQTEGQNNISVLWKENFNIHIVNVSQDDVSQSMLFLVEFLPVVVGKQGFPIEVIFSYQALPSLKNYLFRKKFDAGSKRLQIFIPGKLIRDSGLYYFTLVDANYNRGYPYEDVSDHQVYELTSWKQRCVQKVKDLWTSDGCLVLHTSNPQSVHCRCSSVLGLTFYSSVITTELKQFSANELTEEQYNVLPTALWIFLFTAYILLLVPTYYDGLRKTVQHFPVELKDNLPDHKYKYLITVKTGTFNNAGTTSAVYLVLHGELNLTETRQLIEHSSVHSNFQRGSINQYILSTFKNLGPLSKVDIWHNNCGPSPSWFLSDIKIKDIRTGSEYYFDCHQWFSVEKGDGKIEREITVSAHSPSISRVLRENFLSSLNCFNIWNSFRCNSPVSRFTGVQRLTCCLVFILNSAALLTWLQVFTCIECREDFIVSHIAASSIFSVAVVTLLGSVLQLISALLFALSDSPKENLLLDSWQNCTMWLWNSLYCRFHQKHSSHSSSSTQTPSSMLDSSESIYSSSSHSSIPESELSISSTTDEKQEFVDSELSSLDSCEPESPLQKTLSTWKAFENWAQQKQEKLWSSGYLLSERCSFLERHSVKEKLHSLEDPCQVNAYRQLKIAAISNHRKKEKRNVHQLCDSISILSMEVTNDDLENSNSRGLHLMKKNSLRTENTCYSGNTDVSVCKKFLPEFYYLNWSLLITQCFSSSYVVLRFASRFGMHQSVQWLLNLFSCVVFSCFLLYPLLAFFVAVFQSLKFFRWYHSSVKKDSSENFVQATVCTEFPKLSAYERMTYFMKYLRPPHESTLNKARIFSLNETFIFKLFGETTSTLIMLLPLFMFVFSYNIHTNYAQKSSIQRAFISLQDNQEPSVKTIEGFWHWVKIDFVTAYYGDSTCSHDLSGCGVLTSTGCYTVGTPVFRKFEKNPGKCNDGLNYPILRKCENNLNVPAIGSVSGEPKSLQVKTKAHRDTPLWGWHGLYSEQNDTVVLNNSRHAAFFQVNGLESNLWVNKLTQATSIEFLLFNPTSSTFISVIFLFEFPDINKISLLPMMWHFHLHQYSTVWDFLHLFWEITFFLLFLITLKRELWRILKLKKLYWKCLWNCLQVVFLGTSVAHTVCYVYLYIISKHAIHQLQETRMEVNIDLVSAAYWSMVVQYLSGALLFLHLMNCLKMVKFCPPIFSILHSVFASWKQILALLVFIILFALNCGFLGNTVIGYDYKKMLIYPPLRCLQCIGLILNDYKKPEITDQNGILGSFLTFAFFMAIFWVAFGVLVMMISLLIHSRKTTKFHQTESIKLKEVGILLKQKLMNHFSTFPVVLDTKENIALPIEFLLLELETLTDNLVSKANTLFMDYNGSGNISELMEYSSAGSNITFSNKEDIINSSVYNSCPIGLLPNFQVGNSIFGDAIDDDISSESRLSLTSLLSEKNDCARAPISIKNRRGTPVTLPRYSSRSRANNCSKISFFTSSLSSQRQKKDHMSNNSLVQHQKGRIRKTFPMCHADSTSSESTILPKEKIFLNAGLSIRKTKSRGKGKNHDLKLDDVIFDDSHV